MRFRIGIRILREDTVTDNMLVIQSILEWTYFFGVVSFYRCENIRTRIDGKHNADMIRFSV